jgi:hypothetical protein
MAFLVREFFFRGAKSDKLLEVVQDREDPAYLLNITAREEKNFQAAYQKCRKLFSTNTEQSIKLKTDTSDDGVVEVINNRSKFWPAIVQLHRNVFQDDPTRTKKRYTKWIQSISKNFERQSQRLAADKESLDEKRKIKGKYQSLKEIHTKAACMVIFDEYPATGDITSINMDLVANIVALYKEFHKDWKKPCVEDVFHLDEYRPKNLDDIPLYDIKTDEGDDNTQNDRQSRLPSDYHRMWNAMLYGQLTDFVEHKIKQDKRGLKKQASNLFRETKEILWNQENDEEPPISQEEYAILQLYCLIYNQEGPAENQKDVQKKIKRYIDELVREFGSLDLFEILDQHLHSLVNYASENKKPGVIKYFQKQFEPSAPGSSMDLDLQ